MTNPALDAINALASFSPVKNEDIRIKEKEIERFILLAKTVIEHADTIRNALANAPEVVTVDALRTEYHGYPVPRDEQGAVMDVWTFLEKRANGLKITAAPNGGE